jgi:hypothetical protein
LNIDPFPKGFASMESELGAPKGYFPVKKLIRTGSLAAFFCLLGCSVVVFLNGLSVTYRAYQKHGPVMIADALLEPGILAFVLFLTGLAAGWWAYANWSKGVFVYERGLAIHDRKGTRTWRWEEIVSLTAAVTHPYLSGISNGTVHVYRLTNRQNQHLIVNDITCNVEELATIIQDAIFPRLYDQAAQRYNAGQRLVFGPVVIGKGGIRIGKKTYPWNEVQKVSIQQGILKVTPEEREWFGGASAQASVIPNLNVLLNIIHQVVGLKTG